MNLDRNQAFIDVDLIIEKYNSICRTKFGVDCIHKTKLHFGCELFFDTPNGDADYLRLRISFGQKYIIIRDDGNINIDAPRRLTNRFFNYRKKNETQYQYLERAIATYFKLFFDDYLKSYTFLLKCPNLYFCYSTEHFSCSQLYDMLKDTSSGYNHGMELAYIKEGKVEEVSFSCHGSIVRISYWGYIVEKLYLNKFSYSLAGTPIDIHSSIFTPEYIRELKIKQFCD
jgi:hypothetical protein